ncbi:NAD(P)-binding domain-containing protein, partial [Nocardia brasiliensis]|uniref:NAD(P)-binding domain-containing protein n=1 Tax=Nocardia brasiliensis TaxID=37326 RepID=UPI0024568F3C
MSEQNTPRSVSVVGLGPMGQSMVRALLDAGVEVSGWYSRTAKVDAKVENGGKRADKVAAGGSANQVAGE